MLVSLEKVATKSQFLLCSPQTGSELSLELRRRQATRWERFNFQIDERATFVSYSLSSNIILRDTRTCV